MPRSIKKKKKTKSIYILFAVPEGNDIGVARGDDASVFRHLHTAWNGGEVESLDFLPAVPIPHSQRLVVGAGNQGRVVIEESDMPDTTRVS